MLALAVFGVGLERPHHRARPAHPAAGPGRRLRRAGDAVRRHRRRHPHRQRLLVALRRRGLPALSPPRRAGHHDAAQPRVRVVVVGWPWCAGLVSSAQNVTTQRTQATAVAAGHQRAGQAGRHHRLLSRPARAVGLPPDPRPLAVRHDHVPPRTGPADRRLGRLRRHRRTRPARAPSPPSCCSKAAAGTTSGWSGSRCTRPTASSASRSRRTSLTRRPRRRRRPQRRHGQPQALLRADEPDRVRPRGP